MKTFLLLLTILFVPQISFATTKPVFPQACQEHCITPFGVKLGETRNGIKAYSNCSAKCVYQNPSMVESTFAGIQWQCVEFARRWLMKNKTLTFESIDVAADLWNKVDHLTNFKTQKTIALTNHVNGSSVLPKHGDLLIYSREYLGTGHVAIVLKVNKRKRLVYVGEENFSNQKWPGHYARAIPFIRHNRGYWLLDPYLIGWKSY